MKIRNFIFSGFMASILMAGAAYAEESAPTVDQSGFLTTKSYVDSAARWAKSKGEAAATTAKSEAIAAAAADATTKANAVETKLDTHIADSVKHITAAERTAWNTAAELAGSALQDSDLSDLEARMDTAESTITSHGTRLTSAEGTISSNTTSIETNAANIVTLDGRLDTAEADIGTLEAAVNDTTTGLAKRALQTDLAAEANRATSAEQAISELVSGLDGALDAEVTRATGAEGTLTTNLANEVTRATAAEEALDGRLDTAEATIADHGTSIETNADAITAEETRAKAAEQANATNIATNAADIASISAQLEDFVCSGSACYVDNAGALQPFSSISSWVDLTD